MVSCKLLSLWRRARGKSGARAWCDTSSRREAWPPHNEPRALCRSVRATVFFVRVVFVAPASRGNVDVSRRSRGVEAARRVLGL